jgi:hypothetical protein
MLHKFKRVSVLKQFEDANALSRASQKYDR